MEPPPVADAIARRSILPRVALALCGLSYAIGFAGCWVLLTRSQSGAPALAMAMGGALVAAAALVTGIVGIVQGTRNPARLGVAPAIAGTLLAGIGLVGALFLCLAAALTLSLQVVPVH